MQCYKSHVVLVADMDAATMRLLCAIGQLVDCCAEDITDAVLHFLSDASLLTRHCCVHVLQKLQPYLLPPHQIFSVTELEKLLILLQVGRLQSHSSSLGLDLSSIVQQVQMAIALSIA
jgi:hypothetical protein